MTQSAYGLCAHFVDHHASLQAVECTPAAGDQRGAEVARSLCTCFVYHHCKRLSAGWRGAEAARVAARWPATLQWRNGIVIGMVCHARHSIAQL